MGGVSVLVIVELLLPVSSFRNRELQREDREQGLRQELMSMRRLGLVSAATFRNAEILVEMYVVNSINLSLYNKL
jgi:hypothetical protein